MKSYLSLIPISAKVKKRQNRMTIWCIIISVLLVTTVFSVADMSIRAGDAYLQDRHGYWHLKLKNISPAIAEEIRRRPDVTAAGWSETFNFDADQPYYIQEKTAALFGTDEVYMTLLVNAMEEGTYPQNNDEIVLSSNAKLAWDVQLGDRVTLSSPAGNKEFTVSGFGCDDREYFQGQTYLIAVSMTQAAFRAVMEENGNETAPVCYVQFESAAKASRAKAEIQEKYHLPTGCISENTAVMGAAGQSSNSSVNGIYQIAAVVFVMVLLAGVLMISGSMNSNVTQRTKFFGMMRCIGASQQQIIRFVRLEALNWCKTAVPAGLVFGTAISWGVCALLRYGIGGEFAAAPVFAISPVGLICGAAVGVITVLLAAQSPAKRAAKVSPIAAAAGNTTDAAAGKRALRLRWGKVEQVLGVHHAVASKKNWFFMTASFALSMILLLCFSVGLDFAHELIPSLRPWYVDVSLNGYSNALVLDQNLWDKIHAVSGVKNMYGTSYRDVSVTSSREGVDLVHLVSYSDFLLDSSGNSVIAGDISAIYGKSHQLMIISDKDNPLQVGDTLQIAGEEMEITCAVSSGLWPSESSVICSVETFAWLTGEQNYSVIGIQLDNPAAPAADASVREISGMIENNVVFSDMRESNRSDASTYLAAKIVLYSFLAVIALITLFNIINSISMSVTARIRQYGAMRAVGMDGLQLTQMIAAEAFTYGISGLIVGCGVGIPLSRFLHIKLLTRYFGIAWRLPVKLLLLIAAFDFCSAVIAVYAPSKRMREMAVTETINEL